MLPEHYHFLWLWPPLTMRIFFIERPCTTDHLTTEHPDHIWPLHWILKHTPIPNSFEREDRKVPNHMNESERNCLKKLHLMPHFSCPILDIVSFLLPHGLQFMPRSTTIGNLVLQCPSSIFTFLPLYPPAPCSLYSTVQCLSCRMRMEISFISWHGLSKRGTWLAQATCN